MVFEGLLVAVEVSMYAVACILVGGIIYKAYKISKKVVEAIRDE